MTPLIWVAMGMTGFSLALIGLVADESTLGDAVAGESRAVWGLTLPL